MIEKLQEKMNQEGMWYEDSTFFDWVQNEMLLMKNADLEKLFKEILNEEKFTAWNRGNFYTFRYNYKNEPKSKFVPSFDRQPLIYLLKQEGQILHGFNLNYLNPTVFLKHFMHDLYSFYYGNFDEDESSSNSRILATYRNIERYDRLFISKVIYRKYTLKNINAVKVIPKRFAKIYACLGNGIFPKASKGSVYAATNKHINYKRSQR